MKTVFFVPQERIESQQEQLVTCGPACSSPDTGTVFVVIEKDYETV